MNIGQKTNTTVLAILKVRARAFRIFKVGALPKTDFVTETVVINRFPQFSPPQPLLEEDNVPEVSPSNIEEQLKRLHLTALQEKRIHQFIVQKEQVLVCGSIKSL